MESERIEWTISIINKDRRESQAVGEREESEQNVDGERRVVRWEMSECKEKIDMSDDIEEREERRQRGERTEKG